MSERVHLYSAELYPYYNLTDNEGGVPADVPREQLNRWRGAMAAFHIVQDEMQAVHDEAHKRESKAAEVRKAEAAVAEAQARLEQVRYEQEHPLDEPTSWPAGDPVPIECRGRRYTSQSKAWEGRVEVYDTVTRRGGSMTGFDIAPYTCVEGHWHLGRAS